MPCNLATSHDQECRFDPEYLHNYKCNIDFIKQLNKQVNIPLHFRHNIVSIVCFCSILPTKIVQHKATAELLCISEQHKCFIT